MKHRTVNSAIQNLLPIVQRLLERAAIRGKGRIANLLLQGKGGEAFCYPIRGLKLRLDPQQRIERLMWAGAYERRTVRMLKSYLKPGMVFLDLGANIGYFSAIAAFLVGVSGRVFAFEPSPDCARRLQENLRGFEQATICTCAACDRGGRGSLYLHPAEHGWGSLHPSHELTRRIDVDLIRLDDWAQEAALQRLDLVKIDIEGGEYVALVGAQAVLRRFRPVLVVELNPVCLARDHRAPDDVLQLLCDAGYRCRPTEDGVIATPQGK